MKNGSTYKKTQAVEVSDKNLKSVTVNGKAVEDMDEEFTLAGNKNTTYEIKATDKAGNTTIVKVIMEKEADDTADESADKTGDEEDSEDIEEEKRVSPKTGDDSNILLWLMIMLFGGAGYFVTILRKRENGSF